MLRKYLAPFIGLFLALQITSVGPASAAEFEQCVREVAYTILESRTEMQRSVRDLIVRNRPELKPIALVSRELQVLLAKARLAKLDYLLANDPKRIDTSNGLAKFSNFDWTPKDTALLESSNASFRELEDQIEVLREYNDEHADWPKMRAYFRDELSKNAEFRAVMARFQKAQHNAESTIAQCRHS